MITSTLSAKNQTTISVELLRRLHLRAGARFAQSVEKGRIILQPIGGVSSAFGALRSKQKKVSATKERVVMEKAVGRARGGRKKS